ncbi:hypothetical protein [Cohnella fermenti]|uniref:Uncharacterized protein n=1 Tax=Cohnella fermenti TaxID=2565925 RepID=A0A4S4C8K0_9BACL|nr:hypothetical protein [Cohnella fermenti]THF83695.1 hypothetical protein E6C55_03110 [Cohnella fermenti]
MIAWGRIVRSITLGMVIAVLAIGLLPFLLVYALSDMNGVIDLDSTPFCLFLSRFIQRGKRGR